MKFLRYGALIFLTLQSFGLSAMNDNEINARVNKAMKNDNAWFENLVNVAELKDLINKSTHNEKTKNSYLKIIQTKIDAAKLLRDAKAIVQNPSIKKIFIPSAEVKVKQEGTQSKKTEIVQQQSTFITYSKAIPKVALMVTQPEQQKKAKTELFELATRENDPNVKFDGKDIYIQESAVDALIAKYVPVTQAKPIITSTQNNTASITFAAAKQKIISIFDTKHQDVALEELAKIFAERGVKGEDTLRRITEADLSSIIGKYTEAETKVKKEKFDDDLISYDNAKTMIAEAIDKAKLQDAKKVLTESIADLNEIVKSDRCTKKDSISYLYKDDVTEIINVYIEKAQYEEQRDKEANETLQLLKESKDEKKAQELRNFFNEGVAARTLIKTPNGFVAIENLKKGDTVDSWDFKDSKGTTSKIIAIEKYTSPKMLQFKLKHMGTDATATVTIAPGHWFYTNIDRWLISDDWNRAKYLKVEDMVTDYYIKEIKEINEKTEVYNLYLDGIHNFRISTAQVVVHNVAHALTFAVLYAEDAIKIAYVIASAAISMGVIFFYDYVIAFGKYIYNLIKSGDAGSSKDPEQENKRPKDWKKLPNELAREVAAVLGYKETKDHKIPGIKGLAFKKGNKVITPDQDGHRGGHWKMYNNITKKRLGTYDTYLKNRLGN